MNIMLTCSAGMSTSLLVEKMKKCAAEQGKDYKIWAVDQSTIAKEMDKCDVILIGPQVRHILKKVQAMVGDKNIPVDVIKMTDYGRIDGEAVLKHAEVLYEGRK